MALDPVELERAQAAVSAAPEDPEPRRRLARILIDAGRTAPALEQAERVLHAEPDDPVALAIAEQACRELGDGARAAAYRRVLEALRAAEPPPVPDTPDALIELWGSSAAVSEDDVERLGRSSASVGDLDLCERARALIQAGRLGEARDLLEGAGVPDVVDPEAALLLAQVLLRLALPRAALRAADGGLAQRPPAPLAAWGQRLRSAALLDLGAINAGREAADAAVALAPDDALTHLTLAHARRRDGDAAGARAAVDRAVELDGGLVSARLFAGQLAQDDGRPDAAEAHFREALRMDPGNAEALNLLGILAANREEFDVAAAHFEHLAALHPEGPGQDNAAVVEQVVAARALDRRQRWQRVVSCLLNPALAVRSVALWQRNGRDGRRRRVIRLWTVTPAQQAVRIGLSLLGWVALVAGVIAVSPWLVVGGVVLWRLALELAADLD